MAPPYNLEALDVANQIRGKSQYMSYKDFLASRGKSYDSLYSSQGQAPAQTQDPSQMMSQAPVQDIGADALSGLFSAGAGAADAAGASTTFAGGQVIAGEAIGTAANGGTIMSTGVTVPASAGAPIASGGASAAGSGIAANAAGMGLGPLAGIAAGTYLGGKSAYDLIRGKKDNSLAGKAGRVTLGIATGGLSELARPFLIRKTTRDVQKDVTKELQKIDPDNKNYQAFVSGMREQFNSAPPDPSKPFAGKYATFDEYEKAGLEAGDLTGVESALRLGSRYSDLTPEERVAFTQRAINDVGFRSSKGGVMAKDEEKYKAAFEDFLKNKGSTKIPKAATPLQISGPTGVDTSGIILKGGSASTQPMVTLDRKTTTPIMIPRSSTKSPGIGLDGKPIPQWRKQNGR